MGRYFRLRALIENGAAREPQPRMRGCVERQIFSRRPAQGAKKFDDWIAAGERSREAAPIVTMRAEGVQDTGIRVFAHGKPGQMADRPIACMLTRHGKDRKRRRSVNDLKRMWNASARRVTAPDPPASRGRATLLLF